MVIILESPNKAKKVRDMVSAKCLATYGHFCDLPQKQLAVDLNDNYRPFFVDSPDSSRLTKELKALAATDEVLIATDPDREGYAIGMFVYERIKKKVKNIKRVEIRSYDKPAVLAAIKRAVPFTDTNYGLFNAFLGRRVSDRLVGYLLSPHATRNLPHGDNETFSVGRVQSPAVRLVVEREREIRNFKVEPFWVISILLEKGGIEFAAFHTGGKFTDEHQARSIVTRVQQAASAQVTSYERYDKNSNPFAPFTTVNMQASPPSQLNIAPEKCMNLAQALFEAGLITYHRTDSVRIEDAFIAEMRSHIAQGYGAAYLPPSPHKYKNKTSQNDAHECIRPTHMHGLSEIPQLIAAEKLSADHQRLYELIWRRTLASQMASAVFDSVVVTFDCAGEPFKSTGRVMTFDGFLKVWGDEQADDDDNQRLPLLASQEQVPKNDQHIDRKQTKPPGRFTEASLLKELERLGIGRPATYANIISTITRRQYVQVNKKSLVPTQRGEMLVDFLLQHHDWIVDYNMTKDMEECLDLVEENQEEWQSFVATIHAKIKMSGAESMSNQPRTPSEKQVNFANLIAKTVGQPVPPEGLTDAKVLSDWIESHKGELDKRPFPPTDKQLSFARTIATAAGLTIPPETAASQKLLSQWIDTHKGKLPPQGSGGGGGARPPSEKQLNIINKHGPDDLKQEVASGNYTRVRQFLDDYFKGFKK